MSQTGEMTYVTDGGVEVTRSHREVPYAGAIAPWVDRLDAERGAVFSSSYEFPGRYTRWDFALVNPPVAVETRGRQVTVTALNDRGRVLVPAIGAFDLLTGRTTHGD